MARYINLDEAIKHLQFDCKAKYPLSYSNGISVAIKEIGKLPTADVAPKSEEGAECPTCYGTGRIGTTNWLTKNMTKKQIAEEKAQAIAEHEQHIKTEVARKIFEHLECMFSPVFTYTGETIKEYIAELKKKYTEEKQ